MKNPLGYYLLFRGLFTTETTAKLLDVDEGKVINALRKIYFEVQDNIKKKSFVSYFETNLYMQNQLLKDSDCMSMRHSVEVRVPFLDRDLMKIAFSVKEGIKFNNGIPKYLLVQAFKDLLPEEIVTRKKQGFTFPFDIWMRKNGRGVFEKAMSKNTINKGYAEKLWNNFEQDDLNWSRVWALVVLKKA